MRFSTTLILTITAGLFPLLTIPAVTATPVGLAHGVGPGDAGDILARGIEAGNPTKPMPNIKAVRTVEKRSVEFDSVDSAGLVQRDVGPSGVVLEPAGGTWINTEIGWPTGRKYTGSDVWRPDRYLPAMLDAAPLASTLNRPQRSTSSTSRSTSSRTIPTASSAVMPATQRRSSLR